MAPETSAAELQKAIIRFQEEFALWKAHPKYVQPEDDFKGLDRSYEEVYTNELTELEKDLVDLTTQNAFARLLATELAEAQSARTYAEDIALSEQQIENQRVYMQAVREQSVSLESRNAELLSRMREDAAEMEKCEVDAERRLNTWKVQLEKLIAIEAEISRAEEETERLEQQNAEAEAAENQVLSMLEAEFRTVSESIGHKTHEAETTEAQISQVAEKVKVLEEEKKQLMQMQNTSKIWAEDIKKLLETLGGITVTHASQGELQLTVLCHQNSRGTIERKVHLMVDTSAEHLVSAKVEDDDVYIEDIVEAATITHMQLPNVLRELKQRITVTEARKSALLKFPSTGRYVVKLDGPDCVSATWLNCVVILIETGLEWPESGPPLRVCSISELPPQQKSDCFQTLLATLNERLQSKSVDLESLLLMADEGLTRALPQN